MCNESVTNTDTVFCFQQGMSPDRNAKTTSTDDSMEYVNITITLGDSVDINLVKDKVSTSSEESSPSLSRRHRSATSPPPSVRYRNITKKLKVSSDATSSKDITSSRDITSNRDITSSKDIPLGSTEQKLVGDFGPKSVVRDQTHVYTSSHTHSPSSSPDDKVFMSEERVYPKPGCVDMDARVAGYYRSRVFTSMFVAHCFTAMCA